MRKLISALFAVLTLGVHLVSCSEDEVTTSLSGDCYISSVSLGYARRTMHTLSSKGEDSTYEVTFNAQYYPFTIDQRKGEIYNTDSLPLGTRTSAILADISAAGYVTWRNEGDVESDWVSYSSSDSIDFSRPVSLAVVSTDGTARRIYTMKVNVHQQDGAEFTWMQRADVPELAGLQSPKALVADGQLYVWGITTAGVQRAMHTLGTSNDWTIESTTGCENADPRTLQHVGGKFYMNTTEGALLASADGLAWETQAASDGMQLVGAGNTLLYALGTDGLLHRSADGLTWEQEATDEGPEWLPATGIASLCYTQDNGNERLLLMGARDAAVAPEDTAVVVWSKTWRKGAETAGEWMYFNVAPDNRYRFPLLANPIVVRYGTVLLACGGASQDGRHTALETFYMSQDNGLTWHIDSDIVPPATLKGTALPFAFAVDEERFLWLLCGTQVWRGRLNYYGFEQQ